MDLLEWAGGRSSFSRFFRKTSNSEYPEKHEDPEDEQKDLSNLVTPSDVTSPVDPFLVDWKVLDEPEHPSNW